MLESLELEGHTFELLQMDKQGENWLARFAVDGVPYPPFYEPHVNVIEMPSDQFMIHMKAQALTMVQAVEQGFLA